MDDLVLVRELIRFPDSSGLHNDVNHVFARVDFDALSECVGTRSSAPCSHIEIELRLNLIGWSLFARVYVPLRVLRHSRRGTPTDLAHFYTWMFRHPSSRRSGPRWAAFRSVSKNARGRRCTGSPTRWLQSNENHIVNR